MFLGLHGLSERSLWALEWKALEEVAPETAACFPAAPEALRRPEPPALAGRAGWPAWPCLAMLFLKGGRSGRTGLVLADTAACPLVLTHDGFPTIHML